MVGCPRTSCSPTWSWTPTWISKVPPVYNGLRVALKSCQDLPSFAQSKKGGLFVKSMPWPHSFMMKSWRKCRCQGHDIIKNTMWYQCISRWSHDTNDSCTCVCIINERDGDIFVTNIPPYCGCMMADLVNESSPLSPLATSNSLWTGRWTEGTSLDSDAAWSQMSLPGVYILSY